MNNFTVADPFMRALFASQHADNQDAAMLESANSKKEKTTDKVDVEKAMLEAVESRAKGDMRSLAASMLAGWVEDGDPEADSFDALAISMAGLTDIDEDTDFTDEQIDAYNEALAALADAAVALGADQDDVTEMIDDDDDAAAERVFDALSENDSDMMESAIAIYTVAGGDSAMLEDVRKKVVRDGKVTIIRKRPRPRRMTSLQKQALKKARRKAHTSVANINRRKSMRIRKKRGL
ncbi:hypothetical protein MMA88_22635 [Salmonella enterica]|uniref:Tail tube protein n=5 Tax=Enterobacteriaceae TaxID=543 RepID=A0A5U1A708_SALER|nr:MULTISPECIES: hypothetical protein [Enterobacteriaceae]ECC8687058.1 hypothetical protein [Salmonella enterica subsp. enterica]EDA7990101.1 hypothetical protein [Salmonella enterica subsp. enterica serovar Enteritidis]EDH9989869.1 hypothetical protein [Salmonella enterica subsp. enterica serovar Stanley]EDI2475666.1 hypothetical protein [Salmonella enterica subsp. enterica serovar Heidelberg]EFZ3079822.1 hypothetical protein [Shigella boydii]EHU1080459.1 hypothetical protein [Salmonella ent